MKTMANLYHALKCVLFLLYILSCVSVHGGDEIQRSKREVAVDLQMQSLLIRVSTLEVTLHRAQLKVVDLIKSAVQEIRNGIIDETANLKHGLYSEKSERDRLQGDVEELKDALYEQQENNRLLTGKVQSIENTIPTLQSSLNDARVSTRCCYNVTSTDARLKNLSDTFKVESVKNGKWQEQFQTAIGVISELKNNISDVRKLCSQSETSSRTRPVDDKQKEDVNPIPKEPTHGVQFDGIPLNDGDPRLADDCADLWTMGFRKTGPYRIKLNNTDIVVICNLHESTRNWNVASSYSSLRGWLVVQRRSHGRENFNRTWEAYKRGFGNLSDEFWVGNEILWHFLNDTEDQPSIFLRLYSPHYNYYYRFFARSALRMLSEADGYKLEYKSFSYGQESKDQTPARGPFMTWDRQQLRNPRCPKIDGGWWYLGQPKCMHRVTNPNSKYKKNARNSKRAEYDGYLHSFAKSTRHDKKSVIISGSELLIYARKPL